MLFDQNMVFVRRASPEDAEQLTQITVAAKRHWDYLENWIQLWIPALTISSEYISENEVWMAVENEKSVAYYSLKLHHVIARRTLFPTRCPEPVEGKQSLYYWWRLLRRSAPRNTCTALRLVQCRCDIDSLWLDHLWVLPEFMGRGIGRRLFQHALERSRARGESVLKIEADPNTQSFYEKMGARLIGEHRGEVDGQVRVLPVMEINL